MLLISAPSPQELDGENLLLRIPHTWITGFGEIKLLLMGKLLIYCLAFLVLDGAIMPVWGEKSSAVSPSYKPRELQ